MTDLEDYRLWQLSCGHVVRAPAIVMGVVDWACPDHGPVTVEAVVRDDGRDAPGYWPERVEEILAGPGAGGEAKPHKGSSRRPPRSSL